MKSIFCQLKSFTFASMNNEQSFVSVSPIAGPLIDWYGKNKRDLPWRDTTDPYLIWISEVILQQTRVNQGLDYFNRFIARFPGVKELAAAGEDEVLKYWQGLGYYSRARNLHAAAREIVSRYGGVFPERYEEVKGLKGIGEYTAAAICSFAYRQPYAVVDGNVYRVLSRLFAIDTPIDSHAGKKSFTELASALIDPERPDLYNQAIMDFGALQCIPRSPRCTGCPLAAQCLAFGQNRVGELPVKQGRTTVLPRYFNYLHVLWGEYTWIRQRREKDIWQNLYEFPLLETDRDMEYEELEQMPEFRELFAGAGQIQMIRFPVIYKHVLSHRIIYARFYTLVPEKIPEGLSRYLKIPIKDMDSYAVSRLTQGYLEQS